MRIYAKAALSACSLINICSKEPHIAWNEAIAMETTSESSRTKGCPRETFLGLAYAGYLKNIKPDRRKNMNGKLRSRAINAAEILLSNPEVDKAYLAKILAYDDKQGAYDLIITLSRQGLLCSPEHKK